MLDIQTKFGDIHFSSNLINKIVEHAVETCDGKAMLYNFKGAIMDVMPAWASKVGLHDESSNSVEVTYQEDGYSVKVYVVIRFGSSIKSVTAKIIDSIYENTEIIIGEKPRKVTVNVTGVMSKNIAKRNIKVSK